jgi:N-hydroxyarylamine O-acetyltransferase
MFNERVNLRYADGSVERRIMINRDDYASVLREEFGLDLSDDELNAILAVRARRGVPGSSHPFFG